MQDRGSGYLARPSPSGLADVIDTILSKGLVIDAYARVSLLGIELVTLDARIVVASVDTYLRFAEATNRLDLEESGGRSPVDLLTEGTEKATKAVASKVVEHKVEGVVDAVEDTVGGAVEKAVDAATDVADKVGDVIDKVLPGDQGSDEPGSDEPGSDDGEST